MTIVIGSATAIVGLAIGLHGSFSLNAGIMVYGWAIAFAGCVIMLVGVVQVLL